MSGLGQGRRLTALIIALNGLAALVLFALLLWVSPSAEAPTAPETAVPTPTVLNYQQAINQTGTAGWPRL